MRQATASSTHVSTLRDYLQVARRRRWLIVVAVVVVPAAALGFSLHQKAAYRGSAQVLLAQQDLGAQLTGTQAQSSDPADRQVETQATLARVPAVAEGAIRATGARLTSSAFLNSSSVSAGANADILTFSFTSGDPREAQLLATAYARSYVRYRLASDTAPIENALSEVEAQISKLTSRGLLYTSLEEKATQLRTLAALKTANASVVQASGLAVQTAPRTTRNVVLGLMLGVLLGVALAFLREALDNSVRSAEVIAEKLELPLLARLPEPPKRLRAEHQLAMLADPSGIQAEAFRMLRTNVEFAALGKRAKTIMVTSAKEQEGKSTSIANLAIALARAGQHVVLVDLDLRRPFVDRFFKLEGHVGLTQVAVGRVSLDDALVRVMVTGHDALLASMMNGAISSNGASARDELPMGQLEVLASGPTPPDPGEFVGTDRLSEILEELGQRADVVLIDAPPLFHVGDGLVISSKVDAAIVVTRMQVIRKPMLNELKRLLDTMPAQKLGFVVTGAESEDGYGDGYGGYYYVQRYERPEATRA